MKNRTVVIAFAVVQTVGLACLALWPHVPSTVGLPIWGTALIVLCPGNFLGGWMVEKLFWQGPLSLTGIGILSSVAAVTINAVLWFVVVKVFRLIFGRCSGASASRTTAL